MSDGTAERWHPRTLSVVPADAKSLEEVAEEARQKGYADGLAQGQAEAKKQGEQTANELAALWTSMQRPIAHQDSEVSERAITCNCYFKVSGQARAYDRRIPDNDGVE